MNDPLTVLVILPLVLLVVFFGAFRLFISACKRLGVPVNNDCECKILHDTTPPLEGSHYEDESVITAPKFSGYPGNIYTIQDSSSNTTMFKNDHPES